jgi:capsular polysaccharide biosynthesis protein
MFYLYVTLPDPGEAARVANAFAEVLPKETPNIIHGTSVKVVDTAKVPTSRYAPNYAANTVLGALGGFLAAIVYVTIMFLKDTRIKDENDLTSLYTLPVLGRIPNFDIGTSQNSYGYSNSGSGEEKAEK